MKKPVAVVLRFMLAILASTGGGAALEARANFQAYVNDNVFAYHNNGDGNGTIWDYNVGIITNATFQVGESVKWVGYFNGAGTGAYAYYDLERIYDCLLYTSPSPRD